MDKRELGITTEQALDAFMELGKTLRKEMGTIEVKKSYMSFNERYGIEQTDDWKILDVECLPDKWWITGKYQFQYNCSSGWYSPNIKITEIIENLISGTSKYRYKQLPTKKSHEEFAEEWNDNHFKHHSDDCDFDTYTVKEHCTSAYIAGRKSMESE